MKYTKIILILAALAVGTVGFYYYLYHYRKTNIIQEGTKSKIEAMPFTSSAESQAQRQAKVEKAVHQMALERLQLGSADAAATIGPTKELEDELLRMLKSNQWVNAAAIIQGLLYNYKWPPDRFSMKISDALVDVLKRELKNYKPPYDFGEGSEMLTLIYDVCNLYDPKALPLILQLNEQKCLFHYGDTGAAIVLSTTASVWTQTASTKLEAYALGFKKYDAMQALGGFTNSPTVWDSLTPDTRNKIKAAIYEGIKDKDKGVRRFAIEALVPIADKKDVSTLKEIYYKDPNKGAYSVREEAQKALTQRPFLWNLLDKETQNKIRDDIYNKLKSKDWIVRWNAIKELAPIADKKDVPLLEKLSQDPVSYVSEVANKTLEDLKAKDTKH